MPNNKKNVWDKNVASERNPSFWDDKPYLIQSEDEAPADSHFMVDLFCGCGGFSTGFASAGFTPILGIDIHPPSLETFRRNHRYAAVIKGDMRKVSAKLLKKAVANKHISVLVAGIPCQGFSLCNRKRHAKDERNFLFLEFIKCLKIIKPDFALLENVSGLASMSNGSFKKRIAEEIEKCGYDVDFKMLNAVNFGVPQTRQRVFFLGAKKGHEIRWPISTHGMGKKNIVTVWEAIGDLPPLKSHESKAEYALTPPSEYQKLMRQNSKGLTNHVAPNHPPSVIKKIESTKPGMPMYPKFKQRIRLHPNEPSPTQVSGGIRPQFQFGHPTQARGLSVRERCRIQSFPDSFEIFGGIVQGRIQTGNAVPPLLARAIAIQIMGALKDETPGEDSLPKTPVQKELWSNMDLSFRDTNSLCIKSGNNL